MNQNETSETLSFKLEVYEGPLDLLLKLIAKNKVDIYDIPISLIFDQYMEYLERMRDMDMEIAGEFINMAAQLMLIKSRMLLPRTSLDEPEEDPREELTAILLAHKRAKNAVGPLGELYAEYGGRTAKETDEIDVDRTFVAPHEMEALLEALERIKLRQRLLDENRNDDNDERLNKIVVKKITPIGVKVVNILRRIKNDKKAKFDSLFDDSKNRSDIVATFIALLQLMGKRIVLISPDSSDGDIILEINYDRKRSDDDGE